MHKISYDSRTALVLFEHFFSHDKEMGTGSTHSAASKELSMSLQKPVLITHATTPDPENGH